MKRIACPICGSLRADPWRAAREFMLHRRRYELTRCADCAHTYTNPVLEEAELEQFYAEAVPKLRRLYPIDPSISEQQITEAPVELEKRRFVSGLGLEWQPGALLDVGFGNGGFLLGMVQQGWRGTGVEFTDKVDLLFEPRGRFDVHTGPGALEKLAPRQYDLITMWHVLEHLPEPVATLRTLRKLLRPEGRLVIAVPNAAGLTARLFGSYWSALMPPWHLQHFSPRSLERAVAEAGLSVRKLTGFGDLPMRQCWTDSMTELLDEVRSTEPLPLRNSGATSAIALAGRLPAAGKLVALGLRVARRAASLAGPLLVAAEQRIGLPSAIVAVAERNELLDRAEQSSSADVRVGAKPSELTTMTLTTGARGDEQAAPRPPKPVIEVADATEQSGDTSDLPSDTAEVAASDDSTGAPAKSKRRTAPRKPASRTKPPSSPN